MLKLKKTGNKNRNDAKLLIISKVKSKIHAVNWHVQTGHAPHILPRACLHYPVWVWVWWCWCVGPEAGNQESVNMALKADTYTKISEVNLLTAASFIIHIIFFVSLKKDQYCKRLNAPYWQPVYYNYEQAIRHEWKLFIFNILKLKKNICIVTFCCEFCLFL